MAKYEIDKDIPMPAQRAVADYPLDDMEVGDSFLVPQSDIPRGRNSGEQSLATLRNRISSYARNHMDGARFRVVWENDDKAGRDRGAGARVFRVK